MALVLIRLEIEGRQEDAEEVVDRLLDAGALQDAINDHDVEGCGPLHVTSAVVETPDGIRHPTPVREGALCYDEDDKLWHVVEIRGERVLGHDRALCQGACLESPAHGIETLDIGSIRDCVGA